MDIKEIRKQLEAQKAQEQIKAQEAYDTGDSVDTIQGTVERLVAAIDKSAVVDLTHLTTQKDIHDAVEAGGIYKLKLKTEGRTVRHVVFFTCAAKSAVTAYGSVLSDPTTTSNTNGKVVLSGTSTDEAIIKISRLEVLTPTHDNEATTKAYVDTADATTLTAAKAYTDANSGGLTIKTAIAQHNQTHLPADCKFDNIISCSAQFSPASNGIIYGTFAGAKESNNWFIGFEAGSNNEFFTIKDDGSYQKSGSPSRVTVTYWV